MGRIRIVWRPSSRRALCSRSKTASVSGLRRRPKHHRPTFACDGNIDEIVEAAKAETAELQQPRLRTEATMDGLTEERDELTTRAELLPELKPCRPNLA